MDKKGDPEFDIGFYEGVLRRSPDYTEVIEILGALYTRQGRIADGLRMDRRLVRHLPENPTAHYNLGCSLALMKRPTDALRALRRAIELGYSDADWMEQDPDLKDLRKRPEFGALLQQLKPQG
ncbi:MAG: TPR end-of-group domain-containing protein [Cephaloticoccus sp.]